MATSTEHRMISKHTPVPFLLEAFPVPPSHIPVSPVSPVSTNPPPSLPPTAPLPPLPGPIRYQEGPYNIPDALKPAFIIPSPPDRPGSISPDVPAIIQATPRPRSRPRSRPNKSRSRANSLNGYRSSGSSKHLPNPHEFEVEVEDQDAPDSDSSIDLHTPLPHLMLRHGLLSPHSKLLPSSPPAPNRLSIASNLSQASLKSNFSNQSDASLLTNSSTGSKHPKDSRDTPGRRVRHRDGRLLRGGIGLTTGLGWSDSEDEDAPSPLTRRLSALNLSRRSSATSISTSQSYSSLRSPHPLSRSISHSILREEENEEEVDEFGRVVRGANSARTDDGRVILDGQFSKSLPPRTKPLTCRPKSRPHKPKGETRVPVPIPLENEMDGVTPTRADFRNSAGSSSSGLGTGAGGGTGNGSSTTSTSSLSLPFPATPQSPVAFSETSPNPLSGMTHSHKHSLSQSSTLSSCNIDKSLPPLPLTPKKCPPSLSRLRTYSNTSSVGSVELSGGGLRIIGEAGTGTPRPSLGSMPRSSLGGVPRPSLGGMPRSSLGGVPRPSLGGVPRSSLGGVPRPSLGGVPRPSLSSPRPSISPHPSAFNTSLSTPNPSLSILAGQSGDGRGVSSVAFVSASTGDSSFSNPGDSVFTNPRDISSITIPSASSPRESGSQSPLPRTLKLLQPGEQPQRPGAVLTYNRNVHDQLKRAQSQPQPQPQSPLTQSHTPILPLSPVMRTLVKPNSSGSVEVVGGFWCLRLSQRLWGTFCYPAGIAASDARSPRGDTPLDESTTRRTDHILLNEPPPREASTTSTYTFQLLQIHISDGWDLDLSNIFFFVGPDALFLL
ncbi:hypothetical protein DFJ58DRAFT_745442 [Suillus subalutaceus]|uniref:uncharacterized protein n=1 Tax=Suillus subalutaceus TaxID=48586 RepID=UPI001B86CACF|nr:uncharacterized protein DFJ58DRAFT_745442 [Suillus subalutaceus]KAG1855631.1 hypothetical protein DFJ58DRAFT_745442 [Suillus subalutaceus]